MLPASRAFSQPLPPAERACLRKQLPSFFQIREDTLPDQLHASTKARNRFLSFREAVEEI